ncbi:hypothetical protein SDC9_03893 [bioreactor metagenome]|uniref:GGDEF domain-containing protein n=1 Tax=bioreactor metagenome TaxID=1076179 RepID=A0A644SXL3_9ZZZZ
MFYEGYKNLSEFVQHNHNTLFGPDKQAILVQIFSGRCEQAFLTKLSTEITGLIPHAHIIGTTTSGEIMNGQVSGLKTAISFSVFQHSMIRTGFFQKTGEDSELGQTIAATLGSNTAKVLILFATRLSINAEDMLMGIQSVYPKLPVAGGNAGHNSHTEQKFVFCNGKITDNGVVGAVLEGESLTVNCYSHLGWQPIGKEMTITKADGTRVYTIDYLPAYEIYRKYLGIDSIKNFFNVIEYPLVTTRHGLQIARTPIIHYEDDSIAFAGELIEGEKVRLSFGHVGLISEQTDALCKEIRQKPVESIFVYSCESRRGFLQDLSKMETEPLQKIAPTTGFFTCGEFFHADSTNQLLNSTMTMLILSEANVKKLPEPAALPEQNAMSDSGSASKDNVAARNTDVLKALTHLVDTVTAELVSANAQLKYIGLHDSLTGLYNRTFFEQEIGKLERLDTTVGVIVCDLDLLKTLNDALGHAAGDKALKLAAEIIALSCPKDGIAARIGGDEFAILLTHATLPILDDIRKRILDEAAHTRQINPDTILYLSIGFALKGPGGTLTIEDAFKEADASMYRHKTANKMNVRQEMVHNLVKRDLL